MAAFYGTLKGKGDSIVTKTGTENTGITASVQSWDGSLITEMHHKPDGTLMVSVSYLPYSGASMGELAYYGTFADFIALLEGRK